ncbi:putative carboxylesterase 2 [Platanthera guangdongensis]|uniref:Carboxylesterase 2 n=1 Tax=Platanthera guangdongensis TaxID=2320717 RepID=A0ABR2N4K8_9ASPA
MSTDTAAAAAADNDELIYDMLSLIRIYRSGRVERFEPYEFVPPSADPATGVESEDIVINQTTGISVRFYRPLSSAPIGSRRNLPILVYIHGGGFCVHRPSSAPYHNYLNILTGKANILAVSVYYRLAPEHPLPIAYDDSWEALQWVLGGGCGGEGDCDRVIIAGDSSGGNIVHNLCMRLGSEGRKVEGMVLANPFFWGKDRIGVEQGKAREGSMLNISVLDQLWPILFPALAGLDDPRLNPVAEGAPSLANLGCGRVLICIGDMDLLVDRARIYCEKLRDSGWGGEVEIMVAGGKDHGYFVLEYPGSREAEAFLESFVGFCNKV